MRTYSSQCPKCGGNVERAYGEMGEGLIYEERCSCDQHLVLGDWCVLALAALAAIYWLIAK